MGSEAEKAERAEYLETRRIQKNKNWREWYHKNGRKQTKATPPPQQDGNPLYILRVDGLTVASSYHRSVLEEIKRTTGGEIHTKEVES